MEKFLNALFSMRAMTMAMIVFFVAIGCATFIESYYNVQASKFWVFNAHWFEILLAYLCINLIANIVRYKMWRREKIAVLTFHLSFIVIIIGAGVTRMFGYEGLMLIREGATVNTIYSADPYLWLKIDDGKLQLTDDKQLFLSEANWNDFSLDYKFPGHKNKITVEYVDFLPKHIDSLVIDKSYNGTALEIVTDGKKSNYVPNNDVLVLGATQVAYGSEKVNGVNIFKKNDTLMMRPTLEMQYLPMAMMQQVRQNGGEVPDSAIVKVAPGEEVPLMTTTLYTIGGDQFVYKGEIKHAKKMKLPSGRKDVGSDYLIVKVSDGKESKIVTLEGGLGMIPTAEFFILGGLRYQMEYGSKKIELPFSIKCNDFMMERYPGSNVASSYASDLEIIDDANKYYKKKRVFMNHVLDYNGFRFFQSGYDEDEKGTRLSVNHDYWGTNITYLGYLLMAIGMVMSLFAPGGRFRELIGKSKRKVTENAGVTVLVALLSLAGTSLNAQDTMHTHDHDHEHHNHAQQPATPAPTAKPIFRVMSEEHSEELASLLVQDFEGRIVPMHTVCDQLLRKLYRSNKYEDLNAVQAVMSMHMYPDHWMEQPVIQVPSAVREKYGLESYASFIELSDRFPDGSLQFKWINDYNTALSKRESERDETEKKLIKLVEKHQVFLSILQWNYMKVIPVKNDPGNTWYVPLSQELMVKDSLTSRVVLTYLTQVDRGSRDGNYRDAIKLLGDLKAFQREIAPASILPSETHVSVEISYNKMGIFKNAMYAYLLLGVILLLFYLKKMFAEQPRKPNKTTSRFFNVLLNFRYYRQLFFWPFVNFVFVRNFKWFRGSFVALLVVIFFYHGAGLVMRWYISGHAPWSNGYEAVVFIAWVTMIAGFVFSRTSPVVLAAAALLAFFMIFVTEMNLLDPEITPLQPVLKSYWLMIHVAIITASYGFLGLAAMLGLINLYLYIKRDHLNHTKVTGNINTLTYVSEMTMTIGLFMLTIGTFLGGIWANESWGRYWGWDPKETWALVSVLVYAIILHLRYIPALRGKFLFNVVSLWGYSAIIFTFFGVNFILVGLHSYAQGDGSVSLPKWVIYTIIGFVVFTFIAGIRDYKFKKRQRIELL
jgi:cytochrome c-type biogenesis protein CcsB